MKKHLLFLGAPGAGKGTQAELLSKTNSYLHLSTGELLRNEIEMDSNLGRQVKDIINRGELVNDELVLKIVNVFSLIVNKSLIPLRNNIGLNLLSSINSNTHEDK